MCDSLDSIINPFRVKLRDTASGPEGTHQAASVCECVSRYAVRAPLMCVLHRIIAVRT